MSKYSLNPVKIPKNNPTIFNFNVGDVVEVDKFQQGKPRGGCCYSRKHKFTFVHTYEGKGRFHLFRHRSGYRETFTDAQLGEGME